tara:strand:+ start:1892 stop:2326 length:435 start_codon:yes stop_codon:yes gene_type:complete
MALVESDRAGMWIKEGNSWRKKSEVVPTAAQQLWRKFKNISSFYTFGKYRNFELKMQNVLESKQRKVKNYEMADRKRRDIKYVQKQKRIFCNNLDIICENKNLCDDLKREIRSFMPQGLSKKEFVLIVNGFDHLRGARRDRKLV